MMKAEMASETRRSRAHTATTGSERAPDSFVAARIGGSGLPTSGILFTFYLTFWCCQTLAFPRTNKSSARSDYSIFPKINATLNGCSAVLLVTGRTLIARGKMAAHRVVMLTAVTASSLFLASYLYYHVGSVHFRGTGWTRPLYFTVLISHTTLTVVIVPMVLNTLTHALREQFDRHQAIAR